ncbi:MAG: AAC(3) family N-acetyltransferase [Muribaculaceae bacterium]|nr:AAC(3) family N-acetyltransferase [Muribaculaceae bacterium]
MNDIIKVFKDLLKPLKIETVVVYADLMHAFPLLGKSKSEMLRNHITLIGDVFACPIWMPTFTFSTIKTNVYDIKTTPSELGLLNEYFRNEIALWRSSHPIFSYAGTGVIPEMEIKPGLIEPYGSLSMFEKMNVPNFYLLQYGCRNGVQRKFLLNYIEWLASVPYRKKKDFDVDIIVGAEKIRCRSFYYVNHELKGVQKHRNIFEELKQEGLLIEFPSKQVQIEIIDIYSTIEYLLVKLKKNPFHLITDEYMDFLRNESYV